jgi:hypothetical protein
MPPFSPHGGRKGVAGYQLAGGGFCPWRGRPPTSEDRPEPFQLKKMKVIKTKSGTRIAIDHAI